MRRLHPSIPIAAAAFAVVSCAHSRPENDVGPTPAEQSAAKVQTPSAVVVTGMRASDQAYMAPPAPPPPPAMVMAPPAPMIAQPVIMPQVWSPPYHDEGRDKFTSVNENAFKIVREEAVSTFSIDVDTASYSWVRASLNRNVLPQPAAVRTEEMINYFPYDYASPEDREHPFSTNVSVFPSPWAQGRKLIRIGIKGYSVERTNRPHANLVIIGRDDVTRHKLKLMLDDHKKDVAEFKKQSTSAKDEDLRSFVSQTLPTLEQHLTMIQQLSDREATATSGRSPSSNRPQGTSGSSSGR